MIRLRELGYVVVVALLILGLSSLSEIKGQAAPLLIVTDTPTLTVPPTDTLVPPTDTLVPPTDTPILPTDTLVPPTDTPVPPETPPATSTRAPAPEPTATPVDSPAPGTDVTPVGTFTLPQAGQASPVPSSLLLTIAGGLLALWAWLLRRSSQR
jgi:hypothetical protein